MDFITLWRVWLMSVAGMAWTIVYILWRRSTGG